MIQPLDIASPQAQEITLFLGTQEIVITVASVFTVAPGFGLVNFTGDGSTTNFSTTGDEAMIANSSHVNLQGLLQFQGSSLQYTEDSDLKGITFNTAPKSGWVGQFKYAKA